MSTPAMADNGVLVDLLVRQDVQALAKVLFKHDLSPTQAAIAKCIAFPEGRDRVAISAHTRFGKTYAAADGLCLRFLIEDKPLAFKAIGPTDVQAGLVRGYMVDNFIGQPLLASMLDLPGGGLRRLKKEVSRNKFTFQDGKEFSIHTAQGTGDRLMGFGGDVLFLDELALFTNEVYDMKVTRMLGDNPESELYALSNPWDKEGPFYRLWMTPGVKRIQAGWRVGLAEGRIDARFVEDQRRALPPTAFQVLYDSEFPDQAENQLIPWSWVSRAVRPATWQPPEGEAWRENWGLDVAEGGGDANVLTKTLKGPRDVTALMAQWDWFVSDTMRTATKAQQVAGRGPIAIDENGVGKGVFDRIAEVGGTSVYGFKAGRQARHPDRFTNLGSELLWELRLAFEQGRIILVEPRQELLRDLTRWRFLTRAGRTHVEPEGGKTSGNSPDFGDSFAYAFWGEPPPARPIPLKRGKALL